MFETVNKGPNGSPRVTFPIQRLYRSISSFPRSASPRVPSGKKHMGKVDRDSTQTLAIQKNNGRSGTAGSEEERVVTSSRTRCVPENVCISLTHRTKVMEA